MAVSVAAYSTSIGDRLAAVLPDAAWKSDGLRRRLEAAGLAPEDLADVTALDRLPVMSKDDLLEQQRAAPPFAELLVPGTSLRRIFQSPGPLYEPEPDEPDAWRWAPALRAAGFGPDDVVLNCFGYHLSPAAAMFEEAAEVLGCTVIPAGIGNMDLQAQAAADLGASAYVGLPSYLKALLEKAEQAGLRLSLSKAFVTAEPLPPSLRAWLTERVGVVRQGYGTAETGNLGWECERIEGLHVPADALVQVCDLTTGESLHDGQEGQVVATIPSSVYPMVRLGTGDLSAWMIQDCDCGETTPRLRGWLGRVGDAVKVRGMFLHPRQVAAVMEPIADISAYRFVIDRVEHRDVLRCEVVAAGSGVAAAVRDRVRSGLRFDIEVAEVGSLPDDASTIEDVRTWD